MSSASVKRVQLPDEPPRQESEPKTYPKPIPEPEELTSKHSPNPPTPPTPPNPPNPPPPPKEPDDPACDPNNPQVIPFEDVTAAAYKIKGGVLVTPCNKSHISEFVGMDIYLKMEFMQVTGSFKERGARYALLMLTPEQRQKGVITSSAGNHAQAVSYHGQQLGIPVTVVMPVISSVMKIQKCKRFLANVIIQGKDLGESKKVALQLAKDQGFTFINGFDHPHIIAGQGTIALEINEQVPHVDAVVIAAGGGGLLAGVSMAMKSLQPKVQIIGVESEACASFSNAMKAGKPIYTEVHETLADGLAVPIVGYNAFATAKPHVDKMVQVKEEWISLAILRLVELEKMVIEGAGAACLAAILGGHLSELKGKKVVLILSGGNIDTSLLGKCLDRGLAAEGRLVKIVLPISDRPGGIAELCSHFSSIGVGVRDLIHERAWLSNDIFTVQVTALVETRDYDHALELKEMLSNHYKHVEFVNFPAENVNVTNAPTITSGKIPKVSRQQQTILIACSAKSKRRTESDE